QQGLAHVGIGDHDITAQRDGRVWLYFGPRTEERTVSAADVLLGQDAPNALRGKIVLVGVSALALLDHHTTARGDRMPGTEIHAQLVENILEGSALRRPAWARLLEALALAAAAAVIVVYTPRVRPRRSFIILVGCI